MAIESLRWLMQHYDKWPNEDNLRHVIQRIKEVGGAVSKDSQCAAWIGSRRATILSYARKSALAGSA